MGSSAEPIVGTCPAPEDATRLVAAFAKAHELPVVRNYPESWKKQLYQRQGAKVQRRKGFGGWVPSPAG